MRTVLGRRTAIWGSAFILRNDVVSVVVTRTGSLRVLIEKWSNNAAKSEWRNRLYMRREKDPRQLFGDDTRNSKEKWLQSFLTLQYPWPSTSEGEWNNEMVANAASNAPPFIMTFFMFLSFTNNQDEDSIAIIGNVEEWGSLAMSVLLHIGIIKIEWIVLTLRPESYSRGKGTSMDLTTVTMRTGVLSGLRSKEGTIRQWGWLASTCWCSVWMIYNICFVAWTFAKSFY